MATILQTLLIDNEVSWVASSSKNISFYFLYHVPLHTNDVKIVP
jgi:hypothetical protein